MLNKIFYLEIYWLFNWFIKFSNLNLIIWWIINELKDVTMWSISPSSIWDKVKRYLFCIDTLFKNVLRCFVLIKWQTIEFRLGNHIVNVEHLVRIENHLHSSYFKLITYFFFPTPIICNIGGLLLSHFSKYWVSHYPTRSFVWKIIKGFYFD